MAVTGIICEYNPLHLGHKKQIDQIRRSDPDGTIVCLMSGNYVQRGKPAIVDKSLRAHAAILAGADLVLELPITAALSSAEGFAHRGVEILNKLCTHLCFGAETGDSKALMETAKALLLPEFSEALALYLQEGCSFPAARQSALEKMGLSTETLSRPNNILATEYCKAILRTNSSMIPMPIRREGSYHDTTPDENNPSATAVRNLMLQSGAWLDYVPSCARECFRDAPLHDLSAGERAVLTRLRTMTDEEFEALPYGSEGLWRKLMHASRSCGTLEEILTATKSKRYTRTRLDRMIMSAFLGITQADLNKAAPYVRILAFNETGRKLLKGAKKRLPLVNAGEETTHPYWDLEKRAADLYGLFAVNLPELPGAEENRRVVYVK